MTSVRSSRRRNRRLRGRHRGFLRRRYRATGTSGPGLALKVEGLGLAVMTELPMVIFDVQRAGPSTGMRRRPNSLIC